MATFYSDQLNPVYNSIGQSLVESGDFGTVRCVTATFTTPASGGAEFDKVYLAKIPKGARILGGRIVNEAMGSNMVADIGIEGFDGSGYYNAANTSADDPDFFTSTQISVASAASALWLVGAADNFGYKTQKDVWVTLTQEDASSTGAWAADKDVTVTVQYVVH